MEAPQGRSKRQPPAVWEELKSKNKTPKPPPEVTAGAQGTRTTGWTRSARESGRVAVARSRPNKAPEGKGLRRPAGLGQISKGPGHSVRTCAHSRTDIQIFDNWWYRKGTDTGHEQWHRSLEVQSALETDLPQSLIKVQKY